MVMNERIRYLGVFDGASYAPGSIHNQEEVITFPSLEDAQDFLRDVAKDPQAGLTWRYHGVRPLGGSRVPDMPDVRPGDQLTLYRVATSAVFAAGVWQRLIELGEPTPAWTITLGPRGGVSRTKVS